MEAVQFDQLPDLCLRKIFGFLKLRDRANCRAVNRQFKFYAEQIRVDELIVKEAPYFGPKGVVMKPTPLFEFYDRHNQREVVCRASTITSDQLEMARSSPFKLDQLKSLFLYTEVDFDSVLKLFSGLKQLEHLDLEAYDGSSREAKPLVLPNLKVLYVRSVWFGRTFWLNTPKLEVLMYPAIKRVRVEQPETIKRIECNIEVRRDIIEVTNNLALFKNLQVWICHCSQGPPYLDDFHLSDLKNLRELQIHSELQDDALLSTLVGLMHQRTESKRDELKLYLGEVLLVDAKQLEDYKALSPLLFMFKNLPLLRSYSYPSVAEVNYNELMKLGVQLSSDFFDRFPGIRRLIATGPVKRDRFEWFLQNAAAVRGLWLTNTSLDQTALDRLPVLNNRLTWLKVNVSSNLITNFDFVLQFEQLRGFKTNRDLGSLDLAAKAFRQLNKLKSFCFRSGSEHVKIDRCPSKNNYSLDFCEEGRFRPVRSIETGLSWSKLIALYDQRMAAPASQSQRKRAASTAFKSEATPRRS